MNYPHGFSPTSRSLNLAVWAGKCIKVANRHLTFLLPLILALATHASGTINLIKQNNYVAAGNPMNGAAYGNGAYVAVGYYDCIVRSTDGSNWTVVRAPDTSGSIFLSGVAYGNGTFVCVDNTGRIQTSSDGLTWSTRTSGTTNSLNTVSYVTGKFVVPGANGTLLTSSDGTNWTSISTGTTSGLAGRVAYNGTTYLLRGYGSGSQLFSATSLSGPWSAAGNPYPSDNINFVGWFNNKFWLFTSGGRIYTSATGSGWIQYTSAPIAAAGTQVFGGIYTNSTYVFYGYDGTSYGAIWTSANGTTFTEVSPRPNSTVVQWFDYLNGFYVECGNDGLATGTNYTEFHFPGATINGVGYGNGTYVIVGTAGGDGYIATSTDWTNWINVSPKLMKTPYAVSYGSGKFVVVGDITSSGNALVATSADGQNWTVGNSGNANALYSVANDGNGTFIAVGGGGTILKSINAGSSWTTVASGTNYLTAVTYGNGMFVAVGDYGSVFYSTTGTTWSKANYTIDSAATIYGVTYGPNGFVISGADVNYNLFFASRASLTSGSWTLSPFTSSNGLYYYALVTTNASGYVASYNDANGEAYVLTSTDGSSWNQIDTGDPYGINTMAYLNGAVRIVGANDYKLEAVQQSSQANQAPLVFSPASPQAYGTTNTLTTTGGSGTGAVSYTVLSGPGSIVNNTQLVVTSGSGTITIVATKAADSSFFAISATNTVNAALASQAALAFAPTTPQVYDTTNTLTVTGGSGSGAVTYTVLSGPGMIVNGTALTTTAGTGTITVVANKASDGNFASASVTNTVAAALANQAPLVFIPTTPQAYDTTNSLTVTGGSSTGAIIYSVLSGPGLIVNGTELVATAGTGTITIAATKAGDNNFASISTTNTVAAALANQAALIFAPMTPQAYNTTNTLTVTGGSGAGAVAYTVVSGPGIIVNGTELVTTAGTGTITITAIKAGDSNFAPIGATNTVNAIKASQTISFAPIATQVVTNTLTLTATADSGLPVSFIVASGPATLSGNSLQFTNRGSVTVIASQDGDANWSAAVPITNTFSVLGVFQITISSPVGNYSGIYSAVEGTLFTNAVSESVTVTNTQYAAQGWNLTGASTASGASTQAVFTVSGDSTLTWLWATNYWLAITNNDAAAQVSPSSGWFAAGSTVQVTATATGNLAFAVWTGDVAADESTNNPLTVTMSQSVSVKANFSGPASISFNGLIFGTNYTEYVVTNRITSIVSTQRLYSAVGNAWQFSGTAGHYYDIQTVYRLGTDDPWLPLSMGTNVAGFPAFIWTNLNSLNTNSAQFFRTRERFN